MSQVHRVLREPWLIDADAVGAGLDTHPTIHHHDTGSWIPSACTRPARPMEERS